MGHDWVWADARGTRFEKSNVMYRNRYWKREVRRGWACSLLAL